MKLLGLILAGGKSSRMGADKALLSVNGSTLLTHMEALLREKVSDIAISRNIKGQAYLPDLLPHKGPLSGIHSALHTYPEHDVLVIPVDLPLLTVASLQRLIEQAYSNNTHTCFKSIEKLRDGNVSIKKGFHFPMLILNSSLVRAELTKRLEHSTDYSVFGFLSALGYQQIAPDSDKELLNVNHPSEWEAILPLINKL